MTNIASGEEIVLHDHAVITFKNMATEIGSENVMLCSKHFHIKSNRFFESLKKIINKFIMYLTQLETTPITKTKPKIKPKTKQPSLKQNFNSVLNMIRQKLIDGSELRNILFINDDNKFVSHEESHFARRVNLVGIENLDFIIGSKTHDQNPLHILRLSVGRCGFETLDEMLSCLLMCIGKAGVNDLVIKHNFRYNWRLDKEGSTNDGGGKIDIEKYDVTFILSLPFGNKKLNSCSPRIKHFLFGSNWDIERVDFNPKTCSSFVKNTLYHQYNMAVYAKIFQLIDMYNTDLTFKYITIKCCRQDPPCELIHIEKRSDIPKLFECSCHMQLCGSGCGRVFHGTSTCDISPDEATDQLLTSHKLCPKCHVKIHKYEGCNHMTCRCKIEFCYVCVNEYEKDPYGHYMVTEHHRGTCPQYN